MQIIYGLLILILTANDPFLLTWSWSPVLVSQLRTRDQHLTFELEDVPVPEQ